MFAQAIVMKKSRPAVLITVICAPKNLEVCTEILFRETTTLGIRRRIQERQIIPRTIVLIATKLGNARVKIAQRPNHKTIQPEYDDCVNLANLHQMPLMQVQEIVVRAAEALKLHL